MLNDVKRTITKFMPRLRECHYAKKVDLSGYRLKIFLGEIIIRPDLPSCECKLIRMQYFFSCSKTTKFM